MNLRDRDKYRDRAWDWAFLNDCWAGRIRPTDVDGMVERNGHFLVLEAKPRGARINEGQSYTFTALARQPNTTILILYGDVNQPEEMSALGAFETRARQPCTVASVQSFCRRWFVHAENGHHP